MRPIVTDTVAWSICRSVCRSICHTSEPCKTAEPIEMPFGLRTRVGPMNRVLDCGPDPPWEGEISSGKEHSTVICAKWLNCMMAMLFGLWARTGPRNHKLDGSPDPPWEGTILGKGVPIVKCRDFLPWAVQKWPNQSSSCFGYGLGWAEGSTTSVVFARWRQCAHMGGHIGATWQIWLNRPSVVAMQSYVITLTTCYYLTKSDVTITNISWSLPHIMVRKTACIGTVWRNYVTVTLC